MGIDIFNAQTKEARAKFRDRRLRIVTADYYHVAAGNFDRIIVYNAYPRFSDREKFVQKTLDLLTPGGRFVVVHNTGRQSVSAVRKVAGGRTAQLQSADVECGWFAPFFEIDTCVDNDDIYMISGVKR